jgi:hypothetical protein
VSKKGLCELLAKYYDMHLEDQIQDEEVKYFTGFFDVVSQKPLYDLIIASDGYFYRWASLRDLIKSSVQINKQCFSLHIPNEVSKHSFANIVAAP